MAFTVLENAMSVIFIHRVAIRRRHFLVSQLPYCHLSPGSRRVVGDAGLQQSAGDGNESVDFLGRNWPLAVSGVSLSARIGGEIFVITSVYLVMPVGRLSLRRALIGGVTAVPALGAYPPCADLVPPLCHRSV
jgi:hypothetical protein